MKLKLITLLVCCFGFAFTNAQSIIKGTVTDEFEEPLPGVNIILKGTKKGVLTDYDGNFQINATEGQVLVFSYIGFQTKEVIVISTNNINVKLVEDENELDEVVVVGYGTQKKGDIIGAVSQVKGETLVETGSPNIANALSGLSAGINVVQTSGQPGANGGQIFIRGTENPLILVDGVEIVGGFENIDPRDIESISILKDGSETAVYGIRGANGVIIITTKRGNLGKPKVSLSSQFTVKRFQDRYESLNAFQAESLRNVGVANDGNFSNGYSPQEYLDYWRDGTLPYVFPDTDWVDFVVRDFATSNNHTVSVRGGTEFVKYYASAGYLHEGDLMNNRQLFSYDPSYNFDRYSFRANLDFTLTNTTQLKTSINSRLDDRNSANGNSSTVSDTQFLGFYTFAPGEVALFPAEALEKYPDPLYPGLVEPRIPITPSFISSNGVRNIKNTVFSIDFELNQKLDFITKGLSFTGKFNYISNYQTIRSTTIDGQNRIDRYLLLREPEVRGTWDPFEDPDYERSFDYNIGNEFVNNNSDITYYRATLNYKRSFGKHNFEGLALVSRHKRINNTTFPSFNEDYVGRFNYNYNSTYFLKIAGAYNGDEAFAEGFRFQLFPSVSAAVNLAKIGFIKDNIDFLNNLKLRYAYGETGQRSGLGNNRWQYDSFFGDLTGNFNLRPTNRYFFGEGDTERLDVVVESQIGNASLTWSTTTSNNFGLDFGFLNNKLTGSVDIFHIRKEGIIQRLSTANVPLYFGSTASLPFANIGETENRGYEFELTYKNRTSGGFAYSLTGIYGFYENRIIINTNDGPGTPEYTRLAGKPIGTTPLLQTDGYFQNIDEVVNYPTYVGIGLGDYRYVDYNANGTVIGTNTEDQVRFNLPTAPRNTYSLRLNGSFKGWSASALINGIFNHQGLENANLAYAIPGGVASGRVDHLDYWTPDNRDARYPAIHAREDNPNLSSATTARIIDLDYIKLRTLNISYNFNTDNINNISSLRLSFTGNNLATFSKLKYADPEGNRPGAYPLTQRFNLGLNVGF